MKQVRKIVFDLSKINDSDLESVGVYKIINKENGHFYIGSSDRTFKERFKEHCRYYEMYKEGSKQNQHPKLWSAYDKYGIENFSAELVEILDGKTSEEILQREEYYILNLNPEYNICKYPTQGGKPNLDRKLSEEWKQHIGEK
jgi:group I intron endonuclease